MRAPDRLNVSTLSQAHGEKVCAEFFDKMQKAAEDDRAGYCAPMRRDIWPQFIYSLTGSGDWPDVYNLVPVELLTEDGPKDGMMVLFPWRDREQTFVPKVGGNIQVPRGCNQILDTPLVPVDYTTEASTPSNVLYDINWFDKTKSVDSFEPRYIISDLSDVEKLMFNILTGKFLSDVPFVATTKESFDFLYVYEEIFGVKFTSMTVRTWKNSNLSDPFYELNWGDVKVPEVLVKSLLDFVQKRRMDFYDFSNDAFNKEANFIKLWELSTEKSDTYSQTITNWATVPRLRYHFAKMDKYDFFYEEITDDEGNLSFKVTVTKRNGF